MLLTNYSIRQIEIDELSLAVQLLNSLPEFDAVFYEVQLRKRLMKAESILLIAETEGTPIGCKLAYNRYFDGSIYSWLGGVLPACRQHGVAQALLHELQNQARIKLFLSIRMKSRNYHKAMLCFAIKNDFLITGIEERNNKEESRIELLKML